MGQYVGDPKFLEQQSIVSFRLHVNKRGMPQASRPLWKLMGWQPVGKSKIPQFGEFVGKIMRVLSRGSGFVDCPEVRSKYGWDAYIHDLVIKQCQVVVGDIIAFFVHINAEGYPQVSSPLWKECPHVERTSA